jgi:hypothetical protein
MTSTLRAVAFALAGLACGHALADDADADAPEKPSLHAAAIRTISAHHTPAEPPLRLYLDARPGVRFGNPTALPERAPRIGVEFKLAPTPTAGIAKGTLLRKKLSEGTHLSLRVRRHGVAVVLRSEF